MDFTKTYHTEPYAAIAPTLPALSQHGRTVMITGGSSGIGFAIARAFVAACASRLIIIGRRLNMLEEAKLKLGSSKTEILLEQCDVGNADNAKKLWEGLAARKIAVDILVLNAASTDSISDLVAEGGPEQVWAMYEFNVLAQLRMAQQFLHQGSKKDKALINVSTLSTHMNPHMPGQASYAATKSAFSNLFQYLSDDVKVDETQMINLHPGSIFTEGVREHGFDEHAFKWDHEDLPGHFAVWAASKDAAFLHGRFVWSNWDINELKDMKEHLDSDIGCLRLGLQGPKSLDSAAFLKALMH